MTIKHCLLFIILASSLSAQADQSKSSSTNFSLCGLNKQSRQLAKLIITDPNQQRTQLSCNPLLAKIANLKAKEMAKLEHVSHIGRKAANRRLIDSGYALSRIYPRMFENNVEAVAGGIKDAKSMWRSFKQSDGHRTHLLAEHEFYLLQNEIGVGFFKDKKTAHVEYWVVYIAHQNELKTYQGEIAKSKD
jgi:uncharacterized protein YkwD